MDLNDILRTIESILDDAQTAIPAMHQALAGAGITVALLERIQPSIEDVFVALAQEKRNGSPD